MNIQSALDQLSVDLFTSESVADFLLPSDNQLRIESGVRKLLIVIIVLLACAVLFGRAVGQDDLPLELDASADDGSLPVLPLPGMGSERPELDSLELIPALTLTREHFDEQLRYSGAEQLEQWLGDIDIEGGLGDVFFPGALRLRGALQGFPGTDISVGGELRCGGSLDLAGGLDVDQAIRVGGSLRSDSSVLARAAISVGGDVDVAQSIAAGGWLYSGGAIRAGGRIWSGGLLECRGDVTSGLACGGMDGIRCGGSIACGGELTSGAGILSGGGVTAGTRIILNGLLFCGTDPRAGREPQAVVKCSELLGGELAWGELEIREAEESAEED